MSDKQNSGTNSDQDGARGVVYGDIGTSPIYALREWWRMNTKGHHLGMQNPLSAGLGIEDRHLRQN